MPLIAGRVSLQAVLNPGEAMPNTLQMRDYAGRYDSGELGACAEVTAGRVGVALRFGRGSLRRLELPPAAPDEFRLGSMVARFHRDGAGAVTGFSYSDPLLPSLRFMRPGRLTPGR